jgi:hypothetical protein
MASSLKLSCDGCGQNASTEHIARRLQRLEWTTRYRPVHISTLLLGDCSPLREEEFLYSPAGEFHGEARLLLEAAGISSAGKSKQAVQAEFQRAGFFLTHILECPIEKENGHFEELNSMVERRLSVVGTRIRRSLKPKRVVLIANIMEPVVKAVVGLEWNCPLILDRGKPFALDGADTQQAALRLRDVMTAEGN